MSLTANGERQSPVYEPITRSSVSVDSTVLLPPSRTAQPTSPLPPARSGDNDPLPVPVSRSRDEDRSTTKPRIWSLAEVATSDDYRPKHGVNRVVSPPEFRPSAAEFRPWRAAESNGPSSWGLGAWQAAALLSAGNLSATRWHQNNADVSD